MTAAVASTSLFDMVDGHWLSSNHRDPRVLGLYRRHYSFKGKASNVYAGFVGFGDHLVLLNVQCDAAFIWVRPPDGINQAGQRGVNCLLFRNESSMRSSEMIAEAMELAWRRWPGERLYTYVNARKIRSTNPGACFRFAGWRRCGQSKGGLVILECLPEAAHVPQ